MGRVTVVILVVLAVVFAIFMQHTVGDPPLYTAAQVQAKEEGPLARFQLAVCLGPAVIIVVAAVAITLVGRMFFVQDTVAKRINDTQDVPPEFRARIIDAPVGFGMNKELFIGVLLIVVVVAIYFFVSA